MKFLMQHTASGRSLLSVSLVCFALLGCGGDGGDSPDEWSDVQPLVITAANMADVAGAVIMSNSVGSSLVGGTDIIDEGDAAAGVVTSSTPGSATSILTEFALDKLNLAKEKLASQDVVSGVELPPIQIDCEIAGFITLTLDDRDDNSDLSAGDVITITANNCQEYDDLVLETLTGTLRMTIDSISFDPNTFEIVTLGLIAEYINLKFDRPDFVLSTNGVIKIFETVVSATQIDYTITSNALTYTVLIGSESYKVKVTNLDYVGTETLDEITAEPYSVLWQATESLAVIFPTLMGSFEVTTPVPVLEYYKTIDEGTLKVSGANNSQLFIEFPGENAVLLKLDADGNGTIDETLETTVDALNPIFDFD